MSARYDPRVNLEYYTREAIRNADIWTDSAVRAEYSRLRDIAQKRLKRLAKSEPQSYAYRANVGEYPPARGQDMEEIRMRLPQLAKFIAAKTGSVSGIQAQRMKAVKTFQERGYNFINKYNIKEFGDFMEAFKSKKGKTRVYGSFDAVELWEFTQEQGIDPNRVAAQFAQWLGQQKALASYVQKRHEEGEGVTSDMVLREFNRLEQARLSVQRQQQRAEGMAELRKFADEYNISFSTIEKDSVRWLRQRKALQKYVKGQAASGADISPKDIKRELERLEKVRKEKQREREAKRRG